MSDERDAVERLRGDLAAFQSRTEGWLHECFDQRIATARDERTFRFLEEAMELAQAEGLTRADMAKVADYVFGRDVGETAQEVGGVMVTLAALCWNAGLSLHDAAWTEMERVERPEVMAKVRAKQDAKSAAGMSPALANPEDCAQGAE